MSRLISASSHHRALSLRLWCYILMISGLVIVVASSTVAAPKAKLWPRWQKRNPNHTQMIDHAPWDTFLRKYVLSSHPSGINRVRYGEVTPEDHDALRAYLKAMEAIRISTYNGPEQKAYWINLYNALTVSVVLEHYPVNSIRDINLSSGLFSKGPWGAKLLIIEGEPVSLDDIEHRILRPIWQDNRIHYAVNCASLGCPNLMPIAFTSANLERLLERGAREYVNHPRGASFHNGKLTVSSIYVWFKSDFGGSRTQTLSHLQQYAEGELATRLKSHTGGFSKTYDWALNTP